MAIRNKQKAVNWAGLGLLGYDADGIGIGTDSGGAGSEGAGVLEMGAVAADGGGTAGTVSGRVSRKRR